MIVSDAVHGVTQMINPGPGGQILASRQDSSPNLSAGINASRHNHFLPHLNTPSSTDVDVTHYLDPVDPNGPIIPSVTESASRVASRTDNNFMSASHFDPLTWRYLSVMEAEHLVQLFHKHLNPMIALLDIHLHTLPYLRSSSAALLTAVLAAASRFFRKDLAQALLDHAQTIINRELGAGTCDVGLIQALMILVYWKVPSDRSAWLKIGIAIRLAYQLQCNSAIPKPLPTDTKAAREILVGIFALFRADQCFVGQGAYMVWAVLLRSNVLKDLYPTHGNQSGRSRQCRDVGAETLIARRSG